MRITNQQFQEIMKHGRCKIREEGGNKSKLPSPHVEQNPIARIKRQNEIKAFDSPVDIHVHSKRHRLCDSDGISAKWAIDSIVENGLLRGDSTKEVHSVTFSQEKIPKTIEETTQITIQEVGQ